ncbi:MAG: hypothetical protein P0Y53_09495 [Candidatus Pseudobacter hemicellulosilyticus]|uniref:Abi-like protein n=1 Tax=Candidatus Pseudobacter hemicellulosilyticus TaxID=3121375 RepID=A0AAJ5WVU8_9BACT|nr:MAG: hypothetical protein P0Y53_09495 [Pseudobacter sp.]
MKITLRNKYLSQQRFNRYLLATDNSNLRAKKLYMANIRLAQSFHPVLSQFEVILRNNLNLVLSSYFMDPDWIINQKTGFMNDPTLVASRFFLKRCVQDAENSLRRRSLSVSSGKIIAEQMFGFWIAFFVPHHYALIDGQPMQIFPHKPRTEDRASLHRKLEAIKNYRNRMNHCEPLCFNENAINSHYALYIRSILYDLITWMDPALVPYFQRIDNIPGKAAQVMRV